MRETFLSFFERRGHTRLRRYPTVARWRNDVFFTQASIYDFQPWVTTGTIPPPANPLVLSQPCVRFLDLEEIGRSGRHLSMFEMMAHHAFNRADHEVYFKDRCTELCHEFLTEELGTNGRDVTYKEESWEGGGNLGPSLSVGLRGLELATLVFMEYVRDGSHLKPMPLTVVDTGYGLERFTWMAQGTKSVYEAAFGKTYEELRLTFPAAETSILIDHARALNFLLTDGVVPSNSREGYFARLVLRRMLRVLAKTPESPSSVEVLDRVGRDLAHDFPEIGEHREDLHRVVEAEIQRYEETLTRGRAIVRRQEERLAQEGRTVGESDLIEWYDSLGLPPDFAVESLGHPLPVPMDFYRKVAARHESEQREGDYSEKGDGLPEIPESVPETVAEYFDRPYELTFEAHVLWSHGASVILDRTYFYPTGGGQITDTGTLGDTPVLEVVRHGRWIVHRLERSRTFNVGERVHGRIDGPRRTQLMQHHTATHLLNGALRELLGPHVWQAGAYKGVEGARIDITHYRALSPEETRHVVRRVNRIVREDRPVKSYFESRTEAERRFGFTLYQGGAVPGKSLRIVEIEGFDVEACGGTHCTHTSEVGLVAVPGSERIQDGIVRLSFAAGERALDITDERFRILDAAARKLAVPPEQVPEALERLHESLEEARHRLKTVVQEDLRVTAARLLGDPHVTRTEGGVQITASETDLDGPGLQELSRLLTKDPEHVAILSSVREDRGLLFVGSSSPRVPAIEVFNAVKDAFAGKGGGSPDAATGVGDPGAPLNQALEKARNDALRRAGDSPSPRS